MTCNCHDVTDVDLLDARFTFTESDKLESTERQHLPPYVVASMQVSVVSLQQCTSDVDAISSQYSSYNPLLHASYSSKNTYLVILLVS